jgi:hypothetical protein
MARLAKSIVVVVVLVTGIGAVAAYSTYFAHSGEVDDLLASMPSSERQPPPAFYEALHRIHSGEQVTTFAARSLVEQLYPNRGSTLRWHYRFAVWAFLLPHFRRADEYVPIFAHFMPFEDGRGLAKASSYYFEKSATELTYEEALSLVIISRSPSRYSPSRSPTVFRRELARYIE